MRVRVSETYDLSTQVNKMGIVGIHTPSVSVLTQLWSGLFQNFKYMRFDSCDVDMACASLLPADPLQIGTESGDIAPQDMFNPILYKAVSNESYSRFLNALINTPSSGWSFASNGSVETINDPTFSSDIDQFDLYYGLLANPDGWRKAMPQSGLSMHGLYPMVFSIVSNMGNNIVGSGFASASIPSEVPGVDLADGSVTPSSFGVQFRGPSMRMPRLPTALGHVTASGAGFPNAGGLVDAEQFDYPQCYVGLIVLPPAKLNKLYYRLKVTWTIEFSEVRPNTDLMSDTLIANAGSLYYGTAYATQSTSMTNLAEMVDTLGTTLNKIMTAGA